MRKITIFSLSILIILGLGSCTLFPIDNIVLVLGPNGNVIGAVITFQANPPVAPAQVMSYLWDFGDGTQAEGKNVTHVYLESGEKIVQLRVITTSNGLTAQEVFIFYETILIKSSSSAGTLLSGPCGPYEVDIFDHLPNELDLPTWPDAPITSGAIIEVASRAQLIAAVASEHSGSKIRIISSFADLSPLSINASDLDIEIPFGISIGHLFVAPQQQRIRIWGGGQLRSLELFPPRGVTVEEKEADMVTDIIVDGVIIHTPYEEGEPFGGPSSAFSLILRGKRIAIVNSLVDAGSTGIWAGNSAPAQNQDIIILNNDIRVDGRETTVRLEYVLRSVVCNNRLESNFVPTTDGLDIISKPTYRIHGFSQHNYAGGNILVNTGLFIGEPVRPDEDEDIQYNWFVNNSIYWRWKATFIWDEDVVHHFWAHDNRLFSHSGPNVYSPYGWDEFYGVPIPPETWHIENNPHFDFECAPPRRPDAVIPTESCP